MQITGVSRSGRIRKKSYKLIDFEPENQSKPRKSRGGMVKVGRGRPRKNKVLQPVSRKEIDLDEVEGDDDYSDSTDYSTDSNVSIF